MYNFIWDIAQWYALHFGKRIETTFEDKIGYCILNRFNNTIWFVPYDKSYEFGGYEGNIKVKDFKG